MRSGKIGYQPPKKIIKAEATPKRTLQQAVTGSSENNRRTCKKAWQIAAQLSISKLAVSNVSQANRIKIKSCQLGPFNFTASTIDPRES